MATVIEHVPFELIGDQACMLAVDATEKLIALAVPKETAVTPLKPDPVICTFVPPVAGPMAGSDCVISTVGGIESRTAAIKRACIFFSSLD